MLIEHRGRSPVIHPSATIAPNATICGDVTIGENTAVLFGAVITAQGGPIVIGRNCVVMEQAVVRATPKHPCTIGDNCLVGPHGYVSGATVEDNVFCATGSAVFNGARLETRSEVRIHGVVHINTVLSAGTTVPISWVAVGDPAEIRPPNEHDEIWAVQQTLDFPGTVFGMDRSKMGETKMPEAMRRYTRALGWHQDDRIIE
jgi:carbonic anhydrase/acetyltransferase-like protein (isoleucine patch superfamily)